MFPLSTHVSPEMIAHLSALQSGEKVYFLNLLADDTEAVKRIQRARNYHDGLQFVALTDRLQQFLNDTLAVTTSDMLCLNVCHTVVQAVTEKLLVRGFDTDEQVTDKPVASWAENVWQRNRMDVRQDDVHTPCIRDKEAFVIVDWDAERQIPRFTTRKRYVSNKIEGADGEGCKIIYLNNDPDQLPLFAILRWHERFFDQGIERWRYRMTVYYPDSVEKYASMSAGEAGSWEPYTDSPDEPWPLPWVDTKGQPLGIAVKHFRNHGDDQEARKAIPLQNAINKTLIDLLAAGDATAFRILIALGFEPVDKNGDPLTIEPGTWIGTTRTKNEASVNAIEGADLGKILAVIDSLILKVAQVTDTPASRFIVTAQVASDKTQKAQEGPLSNKLRKRQARLGNGWEDCMHLGVRLHNTFGIGLPQLPEDVTFETLWEPAESRDEAVDLANGVVKQTLGIPEEQIWAELGYSQDKIDQWKVQKAADQQKAMEQMQATQPPAQNGHAPMNGASLNDTHRVSS